MSSVDGNPSATSSVESGYATLSTAPAFLGDSVDMSARESSVVAGEPELQSPRETETTVDAGRGKTVRVTLLEPQIGKRRLTSKVVPPYFITARKLPPYFAVPGTAKIGTAKK